MRGAPSKPLYKAANADLCWLELDIAPSYTMFLFPVIFEKLIEPKSRLNDMKYIWKCDFEFVVTSHVLAS